MKILEVSQTNIKKAADFLSAGGTVVYPTETAYGLAADPFNKRAVKKIYQIKSRSFNKPLPLIADSLKTVQQFFILNKKEKELAQKFWPGALTMVLKVKRECGEKFDYLTTPAPPSKGGDDKVAVRISSSKIARVLAKSLGGLVISTSANVSNCGECYSPAAVITQFRNKKFQPDAIFDAGILKKIKPSTIVRVENDQIKIIREGAVEVVV